MAAATEATGPKPENGTRKLKGRTLTLAIGGQRMEHTGGSLNGSFLSIGVKETFKTELATVPLLRSPDLFLFDPGRFECKNQSSWQPSPHWVCLQAGLGQQKSPFSTRRRQ
jgi:hypothetical protein